jgi:hypothetical protein
MTKPHLFRLVTLPFGIQMVVLLIVISLSFPLRTPDDRQALFLSTHGRIGLSIQFSNMGRTCDVRYHFIAMGGQGVPEGL